MTVRTGHQCNDMEQQVVLVVDGTTERRFCTCLYLQRAGYRVFPVGRGEDAMHVMKLTKPLIVITEIVLPVMNGIDLLRRMKEESWTRHVPVLVYTTIGDPAYRLPS